MDFEIINNQQSVAPPIRSGVFNDYYTYSYISRAAYYSMISADYTSFMNRFVRNWAWWADGWVPYFHSQDKGIPSTHIGSALVSKIARKIVGGRVMFKNAGEERDKNVPNKALNFISSEWSKDVDFDSVVSRLAEYVAAVGTGLIKLNYDYKGLWLDALRLDSFLPVIGARGDIIAVKCFLKCFTNLGVQTKKGQPISNYYVVEYRHFDDYTRADGSVEKNVPVVEYCIFKSSGDIVSGSYIQQGDSGRIPLADLPLKDREAVGKSYPDVMFDKPIRLPFKDLGCELVKFTKGVTGLPEVPFGESFLAKIICYLQEWDYYHAAANTDMYLGRGKVLIPKNFAAKGNGSYNSGFDEFAFTQYPTTNPDKETPQPIQFELRAQEWTETRTRIIQDIAINTGLNISTIASFLNDTTAARTAREVSTEEDETAGYVNDKRAGLEEPINKILKRVTEYYGYSDTVVVRWSSAGLTNRYALAEIINMGLSGGFLSKYKAVQMFNFDDDTVQVDEEYKRCLDESNQINFSEDDYYADGEQTAKQSSADFGRGGNEDTVSGEETADGSDEEADGRGGEEDNSGSGFTADKQRVKGSFRK